jgi:DNA-binding HxlR family transcriptional regulator
MLMSFVLNTGAELVGKKWRAVVIWHLKDGAKRFSELKKKIPDVSVKVLSEVLKEMEDNHLVKRVQYNTIPVKVTYEIHEDATDFVDANVVCTIRIAEYIVKNAVRLDLSNDRLAELVAWVANHQVYIEHPSLSTISNKITKQ